MRPGLEIDASGRRVVVEGAEIELTRREFDLLQYVCARPGRVLTRTQLLQAVWLFDDPRYAGARTVDVHVSRLRRKLGRHGEALHTLRGVGYRWLP
jgi:DNA-binding response OmpR family regulator